MEPMLDQQVIAELESDLRTMSDDDIVEEAAAVPVQDSKLENTQCVKKKYNTNRVHTPALIEN